jgi:hypothetical protein
MTDDTTQLAVIGGGPGGYAAAFMAADLGLTVTLIDPAKNPGGVCLYHGCIPSKALLHVSRVIAEAGEAEAWGVSFGKPKVNIDRLRDRKNEVVSGLTEGLGRLVQQRRITYLQGTAAFLDNRTLAVSGAGGGDDRRLVFEHAVIATGAVPVRLAQLDIGDDRILDSTRALEMAKVPKKLLVVGGGYIGLELGTVFAALGSGDGGRNDRAAVAGGGSRPGHAAGKTAFPSAGGDFQKHHRAGAQSPEKRPQGCPENRAERRAGAALRPGPGGGRPSARNRRPGVGEYRDRLR